MKTKQPKKKAVKQITPKLNDSILPPLDLIQQANHIYNSETGEFNNAPLNYLLAGLRE